MRGPLRGTARPPVALAGCGGIQGTGAGDRGMSGIEVAAGVVVVASVLVVMGLIKLARWALLDRPAQQQVSAFNAERLVYGSDDFLLAAPMVPCGSADRSTRTGAAPAHGVYGHPSASAACARHLPPETAFSAEPDSWLTDPVCRAGWEDVQ